MSAQNRTFLDAKERLLRLPEVRARTGMGTTTVYRRMTEGTFPRPVDIGGNRVAWRETQVDAWIAAQIAASAEPASEAEGAKAEVQVLTSEQAPREPRTSPAEPKAKPRPASKGTGGVQGAKGRGVKGAKRTPKRMGKRAAALDAEAV